MSGRIWIISGNQRDALSFLHDQQMPFVRGIVHIVTRTEQLDGVIFEQQDAVYTLQSASWELKYKVRETARKNFYDLTKVTRNNVRG